MTPRWISPLCRVVAGATLIALAGAAGTEVIEMAYPEDPAVEQGPGHFAFDFLRAAELVVVDSGIPVRWVPQPNQRSMHRLIQNDANFCVGGAGITPERRELGTFTDPFIADRMVGVLALKSHEADLDKARSLADLIRRSRGDFLSYAGFNYGTQVTPQLDPLRKQKRLSEVPHNTGQILDMLRAGRAAYALVSYTYGGNYLDTRPEGEEFLLRTYPDMHRDFQLAFLCSKAVPAGIIAKLDEAIRRQAPTILARYPDQAK